MVKAMAAVLLLWGSLALSVQAQTVDANYPLGSGSGRIEGLDFATSTMVVGGLRYGVALDVKVEINGTYGAFTMLRTGMPIRFEYLAVSPTERLMVLIQELPPDVDPEVT